MELLGRRAHARWGLGVLWACLAAAHLCMCARAAAGPEGLPFKYCHASSPSADRYRPVPQHRLAKLQVVARHGDRSPIVTFPTEDSTWNCDLAVEQAVGRAYTGHPVYNEGAYFVPDDNLYAEGFWKGNCTSGQVKDREEAAVRWRCVRPLWSQLTLRGFEQQRALGRNLRAVYVDQLGFLPAHMDPAACLLRSTDISRTQQSAEGLLLGLYPHHSRPHGTVNLWRKPLDIEDMFANYKRCPRYNERKQELYAAPAFQARQEAAATAALRKKLEDITDTAHLPQFVEDWDAYLDGLLARSCHAKPLPCKGEACVTAEMARGVEAEGDWHYQYLYSDAELPSLAVGLFLWDLTAAMNRSVEHDATRKPPGAAAGDAPYTLGVFGGHDTTVAPLIGLLAGGIPDAKWPPYASSILLELWMPEGEAATEPLVRVLYNGEVVSVKSCGERTECPFSAWQELVAAVSPDQMRAKCMKTVLCILLCLELNRRQLVRPPSLRMLRPRRRF